MTDNTAKKVHPSLKFEIEVIINEKQTNKTDICEEFD